MNTSTPQEANTPDAGNHPLLRREFLKRGMAAGAGAVLLSGASLRAQTAAAGGQKVRLAIIGTGSQGRVLLDACQNIPYLDFKAVCDIWNYNRDYGQKTLERRGFKVNAYEDYREMLEKEKELDAVLVATPDFVHAEHTNACLEAGLNVYCEKLMSNTVEGARSMVQTAKKTGKLLQIGHQRRSNPRYQFARSKLLQEAKILGRVTNVNGQWNRAVSEDIGWARKFEMKPEQLKKYGYESMHEFRNWRWFRKYSGGPISDLGAHQIDIYGWFLGSLPTAVLASGGADYYENHEWYDNVMAIYEFPTPQGTVRAFYQVLTTTSAGGGYYEYFLGDQGSLKMSENPNYTRLYRENAAPEWTDWVQKGYVVMEGKAGMVAKPWEKQKAAVVDVRETAALSAWEIPITLDKAIHQPHLENFFEGIMNGTPLTCPGEEGFKSAVVVLKVNEAVKAGTKLEIKPADFTI